MAGRRVLAPEIEGLIPSAPTEEDDLDILADVYAFIIERIDQRARQGQIQAQNESQESA